MFGLIEWSNYLTKPPLNNLPYKNMETHIKNPRILTIAPAIQAEGLVDKNSVKFDEMVKN